MKIPGSFPPGILFQMVIAVRRSRSEGAANADVARPDALVLVLVDASRLGGRTSQGDRRIDRTGLRRVEHGVQGFSREGQVLNRSPGRTRTDLRDVVVRVAGAGADRVRWLTIVHAEQAVLSTEIDAGVAAE